MTRILFDLDNCGVNFLGPLIERVNRHRAGTGAPPITPRSIKDWGMETGFSSKEVSILEGWREPGYFRALKPFDGFVDTVAWAKSVDLNPTIITACSIPEALKEKAEWIAEYLPMLTYRDVIYCEQKALVKADVLIDDASKHIRAYREAHPDALVIAPSYSFNEDVSGLCVRIEGCEDMTRFWVETYKLLSLCY